MRAIARAALIAAVLILNASMAHAADVRVLAVSAVAPAVETLAPEFRKDTGHEITVTLGSPAEVMAKIKAGEIFDALIASEGAMDELDRDGIVNPESRVPLASGAETGTDAPPAGQPSPPASKIVYEGALMSDGAAPEAARAFILFLAGPDSRSAWNAAKLQPAPDHR
jgi:ABC-type molybdate transport system substrate-binding protein